MEKSIFWTFLSVAVVLVLLSIITFNIFLIGFSVCAVVVLWFSYKAGYILDDFVFKRSGMVQVLGHYEISGSREVAVRVSEDGVVAAAVALLDATNPDPIDRNGIERIISHTSFPFKFVMQCKKQDVKGIVEKLQTRISTKEIALSRLGTSQKDVQKSAGMKREIEILRNDLSNITKGETPVRLVYYVCTSAASESRYDAEERAKSQLRELSSQFDALLGSRSRVLSGEELLDALTLDSSMTF